MVRDTWERLADRARLLAPASSRRVAEAASKIGVSWPVGRPKGPMPVSEDLPNVLYPRISLEPIRPAALDVLLPGMQMKHMSGGPNTALNLTYRLAGTGVPVRYVSTDFDLEADRELLWNHFSGLTGLEPHLGGVTLTSTHDRHVEHNLGDGDVIFATAWWTAQYAEKLLAASRTRRFIYLIQDFEPGFYNWSTQYALALQTYDMSYRAVICGRLLAEYLSDSKAGRFADPGFAEECGVFEPAIERERFYPDLDEAPGRRKRLLFYARPNAPRNLFEIGLVALKHAVQRGALTPEWDLWFIGGDVPARDLGRGVVIRQHPWLDYDSYARLLRRSDVGLSLMLSPHTSYPPLEMAACGATVVTNTFANKDAARLTAYSRNIVPVTPTVSSVTDGLIEAAERALDLRARREGSTIAAPATWDEAFAPVLPWLAHEWDDCRRMA